MESRKSRGSSDSHRSPPSSVATTARATASAATASAATASPSTAMPPENALGAGSAATPAPVVASAPVAVPTLTPPVKASETVAKSTLPTLSTLSATNVDTSDATLSSSERDSLCSSSCSSADALDDNYGVPDLTTDDDEEDEDEENDDGDEDESRKRFLVKPMPSRLQVCPVDDLAVEDEKRRRRSRRNKKAAKAKGKTGANGKKQSTKGASRDAESLPSTPSPLLVMARRSGSTPALSSLDRSDSAPSSNSSSTSAVSNSDASVRRRTSRTASLPHAAAVGPTNDTLLPPAVPKLRKDSAAIRRQYWSQLGFNLSRRDLEKSTGRKHQRREGLKVRLNDAQVKKDAKAKGFFQFITSWYAPITVVDEDTKTSTRSPSRKDSKRQMRSSLSRTSSSSTTVTTSDIAPQSKGVRFNEEAELFYIPLHRDYSKRQRECMWPTRSEFVSMVERNLDAVYDEMEREYEAQLENEYLENEGMAREEARQRAVEAQIKSEAQAKAEAKATATAAAEAALANRNTSPPLSRSMSSTSSLSSAVPSLTLSEKQVMVSPRMSRSSHDIRFKYLKHLGINS